MGLEVGWHLRFTRVEIIEALVESKALPQVADHLQWIGGWEMEIIHLEGHALARLTRIPG